MLPPSHSSPALQQANGDDIVPFQHASGKTLFPVAHTAEHTALCNISPSVAHVVNDFRSALLGAGGGGGGPAPQEDGRTSSQVLTASVANGHTTEPAGEKSPAPAGHAYSSHYIKDPQ